MNSKKIHQIFKEMSFGVALEEVEQGKEWIKKNLNQTKGDREIIQVRNSFNQEEVLYWAKSFELGTMFCSISHPSLYQRINCFHKLADLLLKNKRLFVEIEILTRGIRAQDTERYLDLMIEILRSPDIDLSHYTNRDLIFGDHSCIVDLLKWVFISDVKDIWVHTSPRMYAAFQLFLNLLAELNKTIDIEYTHLSKDLPLGSAHSKGQTIILQDADINSAIESTIQATWGYQGILPWSVRCAYVQESIFESFVEKLKRRLSTVTMGQANDQQVDFSYPYLVEGFEDFLNQAISKAKAKGIQVVQSASSKATAFIGAKMESNAVMDKPSLTESLPSLQVVSFRTISEAIALAENVKKPSTGVFVWTEQLQDAKEIAAKLTAKNVWINSYGLPPVLPHKMESYFNKLYLQNGSEIRRQSKQALYSWSKLSQTERMAYLLESSDSELVDDILSKKHLEYIKIDDKHLLLSSNPGVVYTGSCYEAVFRGNTVVLDCYGLNTQQQKMAEKLQSILPKNVLQLFFYSFYQFYHVYDEKSKCIWF